MKEEIEYALTKFGDAYTKLKEGLIEATSELDRDGVIQRFEFTFELVWKTLKIFLEDKGIECKTPKDCLKEAFRIGIIENEEIFLNMLEDRNLTSHLYQKEISENIFDRIKTEYIIEIGKLLDVLKKWKS